MPLPMYDHVSLHNLDSNPEVTDTNRSVSTTDSSSTGGGTTNPHTSSTSSATNASTAKTGTWATMPVWHCSQRMHLRWEEDAFDPWDSTVEDERFDAVPPTTFNKLPSKSGMLFDTDSPAFRRQFPGLADDSAYSNITNDQDVRIEYEDPELESGTWAELPDPEDPNNLIANPPQPGQTFNRAMFFFLYIPLIAQTVFFAVERYNYNEMIFTMKKGELVSWKRIWTDFADSYNARSFKDNALGLNFYSSDTVVGGGLVADGDGLGFRKFSEVSTAGNYSTAENYTENNPQFNRHSSFCSPKTRLRFFDTGIDSVNRALDTTETNNQGGRIMVGEKFQLYSTVAILYGICLIIKFSPSAITHICEGLSSNGGEWDSTARSSRIAPEGPVRQNPMGGGDGISTNNIRESSVNRNNRRVPVIRSAHAKILEYRSHLSAVYTHCLCILIYLASGCFSLGGANFINWITLSGFLFIFTTGWCLLYEVLDRSKRSLTDNELARAFDAGVETMSPAINVGWLSFRMLMVYNIVCLAIARFSLWRTGKNLLKISLLKDYDAILERFPIGQAIASAVFFAFDCVCGLGNEGGKNLMAVIEERSWWSLLATISSVGAGSSHNSSSNNSSSVNISAVNATNDLNQRQLNVLHAPNSYVWFNDMASDLKQTCAKMAAGFGTNRSAFEGEVNSLYSDKMHTQNIDEPWNYYAYVGNNSTESIVSDSMQCCGQQISQMNDLVSANQIFYALIPIIMLYYSSSYPGVSGGNRNDHRHFRRLSIRNERTGFGPERYVMVFFLFVEVLPGLLNFLYSIYFGSDHGRSDASAKNARPAWESYPCHMCAGGEN